MWSTRVGPELLMASDPNKPLLRVTPSDAKTRKKGSSGFLPPPGSFSQQRQRQNIGPKFDRLTEVLSRDKSGLELRNDPTAMAPERLLVFEVRGSVSGFANAIRNVPGLELIDEEEFTDEEDKSPVAYLMVPDNQALKNILSLWNRWLEGKAMETGFAPWGNVFNTLRDLRPWGPSDRISEPEIKILHEEIEGRNDTDIITLEIELVFRGNENSAESGLEIVSKSIRDAGGSIVSAARIAEIAYQAILAQLPVKAVRSIIELNQNGIAGLDPVQHIRPQSLVASSELGDASSIENVPELMPTPAPILALIDGVPVSQHPLLANHVSVDDIFGLEPNTTLPSRRHGTSMASLIIHGDRNNQEAPLPRTIHTIPVLGEGDRFPTDRLIIDLIYQAVISMKIGDEQQHPRYHCEYFIG